MSWRNPLLRRYLALPLVGLCVALSGCGFEAPPPARTPAPLPPHTPISTLSATLTVPAAQLARLLGNMTEYQIADLKDRPIRCGPLPCRLDLHASRTGPLSVAVADDALSIRIPFAAKATLSTGGFLPGVRGQAEGEGMAAAHSSLSLSPNLILHSQVDGSVTLDNGHLRIGPIKTNIAQLWNANQESLSRPLWRSIETAVTRLPLKPRVAQIWADAFKPIKVGKSPVSWLVLKPESLGISQPQLQKGAVTLSLTVSARAHVAVREAAPDNPSAPLPAAQILDAPARRFAFYVPLELSYDQAAKLALASLTKRPPHVGGMSVKVSQLQFLPSGQDVIVAAHFCADPAWDPFGWFASCGGVYLRGTPVFDSDQKTIRIVHLHYDVGSANLMLRAVNVLAGPTLADSLQSHLIFHEAEQIDHLENQITEILGQSRGRDISVSGRIQDFGSPTLTWTKDGFLAVFSATGLVDAKLNL